VEAVRVPEPPGGDFGPDERAEARSLLEDVETLIEDGKTYLEAETNYQRTRAIYVVDRVRAAAFFAAVAAAFGFIALIGLTVGLIIALAPVLTVWGSSALVVGLEFLMALYFARKASERWTRIMRALGMDEER
jgi:Flp pilus assembly protein TadB